jgi:formylglycine-generating enzyme required for sulfatase activity
LKSYFDSGYVVVLARDKFPLPWGLFDMPANTWEWCFDEESTGNGAVDFRIARGGENAEAPYQMFAYSRIQLPNFTTHVNTGLRIVASGKKQ